MLFSNNVNIMAQEGYRLVKHSYGSVVGEMSLDECPR